MQRIDGSPADDSRQGVATTLQDLAKLAACSPATVSRALRDDPRINEETKRRIWQLAHDFNFPMGKYLGYRKSDSKQISVVIPRLPTRTPSLKEPFILELFAHIGDEARVYGADLLLCTTSPSNESELQEFFQSVGTGGVIVIGQGLLHEALNRIGERRRDFVVWGAHMEGQTYCTVGSDNRAGGYKAAAYLAKTGHKNLVFLGETVGPEMEQRYLGFLDAAREFGLEHSHLGCRLDVEDASAAVHRAIAAKRNFDGIVCVNDVSAIGAINALHRSGLSVPGDVSVIGYDDIEHSRLTPLSLSTISQNSIRAARLLVSKIVAGNCSAENTEVMPTELILRGT